jgi:hypothetical protein
MVILEVLNSTYKCCLNEANALQGAKNKDLGERISVANRYCRMLSPVDLRHHCLIAMCCVCFLLHSHPTATIP